MTDYYFLATSLPPLQLGIPPEMNFEELSPMLEDNLSANDFEKTTVIRQFYDLQNIRALWKKQPLDPKGNLVLTDLESSLFSREGVPEYLTHFLDSYDSNADRLSHFSALISGFFSMEQAKAEGFLKEYLKFERAWRLLLTAFRAKQLKRDLVKELQFEDPNDDLVASILAQKDAKRFIAPEGYEDLQALFEEYVNDPLGLYQALSRYRFDKVENMIGIDLFSIDRILAYMVQLIIVEQVIVQGKL